MTKRLFAIAAVAAMAATPLAAEGEHDMALKARKGQFNIMAINLGVLGAMAKGQMPYDAAAAQSAADTLVAVSQIGQGPLWPEGSDEMAIDNTRALPSIWEQNDDFLAKWAAFGEGAMVMQAAASGGQEALGPALGAIGGTCGACHKAHRTPDE